MIRPNQFECEAKSPSALAASLDIGPRKVRFFWKWDSGTVSFQDLIWVPLFALFLAFALHLFLSLFGLSAVQDRARDGERRIGAYGAVNALAHSQYAFDESESYVVAMDDIEDPALR